jgi:hypothetical protein
MPGGISKFMRHFFSACPGESDSVISPAIFSASWFRNPDFMLITKNPEY